MRCKWKLLSVFPREHQIQLGSVSLSLTSSPLLLPGIQMKCLELQQRFCHFKVTLKLQARGCGIKNRRALIPDGCGAHCQSQLTSLRSHWWGAGRRRMVVVVNLYLFKPQSLSFYSMQLNLIYCKSYTNHIIKNSSTLPLSLPFSPHIPHVPGLFIFIASHLRLVSPVFDLLMT